MKRLSAAAAACAVCVAAQFALTGVAAAQAAPSDAPAHTQLAARAHLGAALPLAARRIIEAAEARALWDDPQIRSFRGLAENAWDFGSGDVPGFGPLAPQDTRNILTHQP
jgi:hypothetical protein